jgi:hypothetical protein
MLGLIVIMNMLAFHKKIEGFVRVSRYLGVYSNE